MSEWTIQEADTGTRADMFLARAMATSRGEAQRLLDSGHAYVDGHTAKPSQRLKPGQRVSAERSEPVESPLTPESIPLDIVYEDSDLLVINKPAGMVVHPAPGAETGTLLHAVLSHADDLSGIGGELRPGIVHRIDKDTSGLIVVAKSDAAHLSLQAQIQAKTAERRYLAILWGFHSASRLRIDAPIGRNPNDRKRMTVWHGRDAVTELTARERPGPFAFVEAKLETGRTHQIRVHCAHIGHPVVGDPLYGGSRKVPPERVSTRDRLRIEQAIAELPGQALHAFSLSFDHPSTGERMAFTADMPDAVANLLAEIREVYSSSRS